jgi:hypothetical protein
MKAGYHAGYRKKVGIELIVPAAELMLCRHCSEPLEPNESNELWRCGHCLRGPLFTRQALIDRLMSEGGCKHASDAWQILREVSDALLIVNKMAGPATTIAGGIRPVHSDPLF